MRVKRYFSTDTWCKIAPLATKPMLFHRGGFMASGLTKTQLVRHLAEKLETNNKTAAAFLEHLADTAIKETKKNGVFVVPSLGTFLQRARGGAGGGYPSTGD